MSKSYKVGVDPLPAVVNIGGLMVSVIETNDLNILGSASHWGMFDVAQSKIHIFSELGISFKWAALFHEIYEYSLGFYGLNYSHDDFSKFSHILFGILCLNNFDFSCYTKELKNG